jgi:predicted transcriptional regulator
MQLDPDDTVGLAADIFLVNRFHALPVVDGVDLVGIVTSHDLIALAYGSPVTDDLLVEDFSDI